jgi:UDP-3-O-[3-hydroxymyristoyl] N-acetylglucosamine deacetylase
MTNINQRTINNSVSCNSIGLHTGCNVILNLKPAEPDTGIIFKRVDLPAPNNEIIADYRNVTTTNLGTTIANQFGVSISTVEHLLGAIWGCKIDNLIIEVDNVEIPIMDGSSAPFIFLIECAGIVSQNQNRKIIEILDEITLKDGDKFISIKPSNDFIIDLTIDFNHPLINHKTLNFNSNIHSFKNDLSRARTFCFASEIEMMRKNNLAKGGSLENAIVIDDNKILNNEPLRYVDEFIRHKAIDFIGDLFLSKHYINGFVTAHKVGHTINNKFVHHLFASKDKWRLV